MRSIDQRQGYSPGPGSRVFLSPSGTPLAKGESNNARKLFYRILERAEIPRVDASRRSVDLHGLRTTFGSRMARQGVPPQILQYLMGHADITTTMKFYVGIGVADMA